MSTIVKTSIANHVAAMSLMTRAEKYQYCIDQALSCTSMVSAAEWAAKARHYLKQVPDRMTVSSNGFAV